MSSSTSETSQSEVSSQEDKNYLEQSGSSEEKKKRKTKNKKKDKQKKKKNRSIKTNTRTKKTKINKKLTTNTRTNTKRKRTRRKMKKLTRKKRRNITSKKRRNIPKRKKKSPSFHKLPILLKNEFPNVKIATKTNLNSIVPNHLYKAPYNELIKKANFNICRKHNKELSLYCIDENKLICSECYENCKLNDHEILGLNDFSNKIYENIKMIVNKIKNEENQNKETIQKSLENQNKLKEKIKNICKKIENDSDLLIKKIQDSKTNYLNLFKKIEIIIDNKIETILKDTEKKQKKISKKKIKINTIKKLKKDKNHIELIQGGNEIIKTERKREKNGKKEKKSKKTREVDEKEKEKERKSEKERKEEFDPEMNYKNLIKLKNENKTAWNPNYGWICGKKIYSSGKHEIKIKIDLFPNPKNDCNVIWLGIIKTENRENFIKYGWWEGTYFFRTFWEEENHESRKCKNENGKSTKKIYPEKIFLKKNDIFTIFLDMDQKKISFKINEKNLGGWENLPQKVNFFAQLLDQEGEEKNQITII
ncbi:hypothetical protein M0813_03525 [Anaeramoeba flamelloides]|uniref:B box-type domain-containing protein n=1 Tax=Anaeramoeba flamelloides TaxID=1746091 RepID=A0ABQ8XVQ8_9EUKA|nr:hypothetical protein M0813_03525 [Anaeramoeba flamelloides]